jgi:hypothetical protein
MAPLDVVFVYNKANPYGISRDIQLLEAALLEINKDMKRMFGKPRHLDMREPPTVCDVQFHFEIPIYTNCAWATVNILLANSEQFICDAFLQYKHAFQYIMCRDRWTEKKFVELGIPQDRVLYVPWAIKPLPLSNLLVTDPNAGFVSFLGGSDMKFGAVNDILPIWPANGPSLKIYTTRPDFEKELKKTLRGCQGKEYIDIVCKDIPKDERERLQVHYPGHLLVSHAEGFGYAAAEAEAAGAFMIMNNIPVYVDDYKDVSKEHIGWLSSTFEDLSGDRMAKKGRIGCCAVGEFCQDPRLELSPFVTCNEGSSNNPRLELSDALTAFADSLADATAAAAVTKNKKTRQLRTKERWQRFVSTLSTLMKPIVDQFGKTSPIRRLPPLLQDADCPPISVITLTYNRRNFIDLAAYNLLLAAYPRDKIEWIVVEDSDDQDLASSDKIMQFAADHPEFRVSYVPLERKYSIGEKRNKGVEFAKHDICLFMDDDDYYPETSFKRRVAWLTNFNYDCVATTMLAMYDLMKGTSAVNVPPWSLPLRKRISEASLAFRKSFWHEKKFADESLAEGEEWLAGRESRVLEIPPQQIIVALSHKNNSSGRRIPGNDSRPGCFWGWPKELIIFLHGLVGVKVEEDTSASSSSKKK